MKAHPFPLCVLKMCEHTKGGADFASENLAAILSSERRRIIVRFVRGRRRKVKRELLRRERRKTEKKGRRERGEETYRTKRRTYRE